MNPLVSVVVTTYNQAAYIGETLESVLAQTYQPFEVIVVDDGSTDDTPECMAPFKDQIVIIRQQNQGVAGSRNSGILRARGELIAFLDGDDLWEPDKLTIQVAAATAHPDSGLIVVDGVEFDHQGIIFSTLFFAAWCKELPEGSITSGRYYEQLLEGNLFATTSQIMVPARIFKEVGLSDNGLKRASDYDLYLRIAAQYEITIVKKSLTRWRCLPTSVSGPRDLRGYRYLAENIAVLKKQLRLIHDRKRQNLRQIIRRRLYKGAQMLYYHGAGTDRPFASRVLWSLLKENPNSLIVAVFIVGLWCPLPVTATLGKLVRWALLLFQSQPKSFQAPANISSR